MKPAYLILIPLFFLGAVITCQSQTVVSDGEEKVVDKAVIEVYYFHNTRRCATCQAVESVTKNTLEESYAKQMETGEITFQSLDIEDDKNEPVARELHVSGQSLLFIKGDKKKDLTNDAFLYARNSPEKLEAKIIKTVDGL
jgi:hypothetical protein